MASIRKNFEDSIKFLKDHDPLQYEAYRLFVPQRAAESYEALNLALSQETKVNADIKQPDTKNAELFSLDLYDDRSAGSNKLKEFLDDQKVKKVLVIMGGSGSGKTTLARYITQYVWSRYTTNREIPILVELNRVAPERLQKQNRNKFMHGVFEPYHFENHAIENIRTKSKILLILDGYYMSFLS